MFAELVMLKRLSPVKMSVTVHAAESLAASTDSPVARVIVVTSNGAAIGTVSTVSEEVAFELIWSWKLAHAAQVATERTFESFREIVYEHVSA